VPLYTVREKILAYAVATFEERSVSESQLDQILREKRVGMSRRVLRETLQTLGVRGVLVSVVVRERGGTHKRWSISRGRIAWSSVQDLRR
jgi:hypothetical protein